MMVAYFAVNAVLYLLFSLWCALSPQQTATFLGLTRNNPAGESEYLALYGGLQAGMAVFFALAVLIPEHRRAALLFSLLIYGGLVVFRSFAILKFGFAELGNARYAFGLEAGMLGVAVWLVVRGAR